VFLLQHAQPPPLQLQTPLRRVNGFARFPHLRRPPGRGALVSQRLGHSLIALRDHPRKLPPRLPQFSLEVTNALLQSIATRELVPYDSGWLGT
jgi:hypothetical protein